MRGLSGISALFTLILGFIIFTNSPLAANQPAKCSVSPHYIEALDENRFTLLKLLSMANAAQSPLDDPGSATIHYMNLLSMRHYHESQQASLNLCAQSLNTAVQQAISATQDVIALRLARAANPPTARSADRLEQALAHLNTTWETLARLSEEVTLASEN